MSLALVLTPPADANPVRTPCRPGLVVQIRFTPFAQLPSGRHLFHTLYGPTVEEAGRCLLDAIGLAPRQLRLRALDLGDVVVLRRMPLDAPAHLLPGSVQPAAFVDGLTETQLAAAFAVLAAQDDL